MRTTAILRSILAVAVAVTTTIDTSAAQSPCVSVQVVANGVDAAPPASGSLPIHDGAIATAVIKLDEAYAANPPSEVEVSAPGLQCGRTKFAFTKGDRSSYEQRVTCRTSSGSAPASDGAIVDVPVTLTYKNGPRPTESTKLRRRVVNSGRCGGWGDPHLTTLDGVAYDFQKQGVFRLFESNNFQVQIFQEKCGPVATLRENAPSCYQGVAVAFGASVARFFIVDGKIQVGKGSASLQWLSVEKLGNTNADGYRVFTNVDQGTYVDINLDRWAAFNNYPYLNVALQVSPYFKNAGISGLMGNWNGNRNDDVTNNDQLATAHGAPLDRNLFTCVGDACTPLLKATTITDSNALALGSNQPLLHQGYVAVGSDAVVLRSFQPKLRTFRLRQLQQATNNKGYGAGAAAGGYSAGRVGVAPVAAAKPTANVKANATATATATTTANANANANANTKQQAVDVTARATTLCNEVIRSISSICGKYVQNTDWFINTACVADATLLRDLTVVDSVKLSYLRECRRALDARLSSKTACASETKQLMADRASLMFGDLTRCNKQCSGRGQCLAAGCKCSAGYTGHGCDRAI